MPSLKGKTWNDNGLSGIGRDNQLLIKRSKFDVKIILRESSDASKYELFQRLNMGGSQLSDQEIRNVMVIMVDPSQMYHLFRAMSLLAEARQAVDGRSSFRGVIEHEGSSKKRTHTIGACERKNAIEFTGRGAELTVVEIEPRLESLR